VATASEALLGHGAAASWSPTWLEAHYKSRVTRRQLELPRNRQQMVALM
jgi:hypothetical protein